jgi:UDP-glucose 4-epimerase
MCYSLGTTGHGTLATFLRGPRVPTVLGFDPMFQFMHEDDVVTAIVHSLDKKPRGIFNVAGPDPVPLSVIIKETGRRAIPLPEFVINMSLGRMGLPRLPPGAISHIKYSVVVDPAAFRNATGFRHAFDEGATMRAFREAFPPRL